jgi:hypothetical protein
MIARKSVMIGMLSIVLYTVAQAQYSSPCAPDLTCTGAVDGQDLLILLGQWGKCADPADCPADFNNDGVVDGADLLLMLQHWGPCLFEYQSPPASLEAWHISLEMLGPDGPLLPPQDIYDRVDRDLDLIRKAVPHLEDKIHVQAWMTNQIIASYPESEPAENVDCLITYYQGEVTNVFFGHMHVIQFAGEANMEAMSTQFAELPETAWAQPDHLLGGDNFWIPTDLGDGLWHWWIDNGWHDCFDGCDCHIVYDIHVDADGNVEVINVEKFGMPWCDFPW